MLEPRAWLILLGPLVLAAVGLVPDAVANARPRRQARWALAAGLFALAVSLLAALAVPVRGPMSTASIGPLGVGLGVRLDALAAVVLVLVSFVGTVVIRYSTGYLDGDPRHGRFMRLLCLALASVLLLIGSGNLFQLALAWVCTSLALHRLLLFYPERPTAVLAARKKFVASRFGDLCLFTALWLLHRHVGSLDLGAVSAWAAALRASPAAAHGPDAVALLVVVAALLKSAQFPLHGWLTEVMDAPTPVSALLHAGIINAGGFLVLRLADVVALSTPALATLAVIGAITALFGSVVMLTQTSIKGSLAHSTVAQMGFMMLECGLGAFPGALLHLVAHSLYKAHAFLSSGSVIDLARASWSPSPGGPPHPARPWIAGAGFCALAVATATLHGAPALSHPGAWALALILLMGVAHLVANAIDHRPSAFVVARALGLSLLVALAWLLLQAGAHRLLGDSLPSASVLRGPQGLAVALAVVLCFGAITLLQNLLPRHATEPRWQALYVHVANGLYVNAFANRLALRFWPGPPPRPVGRRHVAIGAHREVA